MLSLKVAIPAALCLLSISACTARRDTTLRSDQIDNRARPATVLVKVKYDVDVDIAQLDFDLKRLASDIRAQVSATEMSVDEQYRLVLDTFLGKLDHYLIPGTGRQRLQTELVSRGTGFIVTPEGHVLTNAHVLKPADDELALRALVSVAKQVVEDVDELDDLVGKLLPRRRLTAKAKEDIELTLYKEYLKTGLFEPKLAEVSIVTGYVDPDGATQEKDRMCDVLKVGTPDSGTDVGVLKIQGEGNLPTLPLLNGGIESVRAGSELFVVGYPGALAIEPGLSPSGQLASSITVGHVNGLRQMKDGARVIQMDAPINPGNSGSPAFDNHGQVIGLATFTVKDDDSPVPAQNLNFVVSMDAARQMLRELHVIPRQSAFTTRYLEALGLYEARRNDQALPILRELNEQRPDIAVVRELMANVNGAPADRKPRQETAAQPVASGTPAPGPARPGVSPMLIFSIIAGLIVLVIALVIVANRRD